MDKVLDEDNGCCQAAAQKDAAGQIAEEMAGGEFGDRSFLVALIEIDVNNADEDGEDGAGDGVFVGLGEAGAGKEGLDGEHGQQADAEGEGEAGYDTGDGMVKDGPAAQRHAVFFKCRGFFDNL